MYTNRTKEEKEKIVADVDALVTEGRTVEEACRQVNIYRSMYGRWKGGHGMGETTRRSPEEIEALKKKWLEAQGTGMNMTEFCKAENINYSAMYGYMNKSNRNKHQTVRRQKGIERKVTIAARTIVPVKNGADKELETLREENTQLKLMVAELCLDRKSLIAYAGR